MASLQPVRAACLVGIPVAVGVAIAAAVTFLHLGSASQGRQPTPRGAPVGGAAVRRAPVRGAPVRAAARVASPAVRYPVASGTHLAALKPVQEFNVGDLVTGQLRLAGTTYPDSLRFTCDAGGQASTGDLDYVVTGYGALTTTLTVAPGETADATVSFFNNGSGAQVAGPYPVSPGHPRPVRVTFRSAAQLEISCTPASARSGGLRLALVSPVLSQR